MLMIVKYGPENPADRGKFELAHQGDEVVLLQNGVFWAASEELDPYLEKGIKVHAIETDFHARGYSAEASKVPLISYDGFIDVLERQEKNLG